MKESILLTEGKNDCIVISNICSRRKIKENFKPINCKSRDGAISFLALAINEQATKYQNVGIVIDADTDNAAAWHKIKSKIENTGKYDNIPNSLDASGLILQANDSTHPRLGVWIMPDNKTEGMLEDFVSLLAGEENVLMKESELILQSLEERKIEGYKQVHRAKAKIHTFLAWQDEPGFPMGLAITAKILDANAKEADLFVEWVEKLFEEN